MDAKIEVVEIPKMNFAYISIVGEKHIEGAFSQIIKWNSTKKILSKSATNLCRIFHDSFKFTDKSNVSMSIGILSKHELIVEKGMKFLVLEKAKCIVGCFEIELAEFEKKWTSLFIWMNNNGYKKADRDPFEIYHNNFNDHPEKKCIVDFYIPVM